MALFKIFNNIDSKKPVEGEEDKYTYNALPDTYTKGYMYFDAQKSLFYIDTAGEGGKTGTRVALNAYGAEKAYGDEDGQQIKTTYLKISNVNDLISNGKLKHTLTFGANQEYVFDGSQDVTVPVYLGSYSVT